MKTSGMVIPNYSGNLISDNPTNDRDIETGSQNAISQSLLRLKTAASYAVSATGISAKGMTIATAGLLTTLVTGVIFSNLDSDEVEEFDDLNAAARLTIALVSMLPRSVFVSLPLATMTLVVAGTKKAGDLLDQAKETKNDAIKTAMTVAKGGIYLLTAVSVTNGLLRLFSNQELVDLPVAIIIPVWLALTALGTKYCIDLIGQTQNTLQDKLKKEQ